MSVCLCDDNFRSLDPDCPYHGKSPSEKGVWTGNQPPTAAIRPTVTVPREQAERTLRVLEKVEWALRNWDACPRCSASRYEDGHAPDCDLAASIADWRAALG